VKIGFFGLTTETTPIESSPGTIKFSPTVDTARAKAKELREKGADLVVANDVSRTDAGFEVDTNAVTLVAADKLEPVPLQSKAAVAARILDAVERLLTGSSAKVGS
jgi:2',3'-cyclic-nucleotide 2'-phosphodiesterase (5'-nucleotidase family)